MPQTAVSVGTASTSLLPEGRERKQVTIFNNGTGTIFIGRRSDLTTTTLGLPTPANSGWKFTKDKGDDTDKEFDAIASVAGQDTRVEWS